jgi:tetratricopeptide (TPR) repeat protein/DNA-binding CsgD family transcriptional regulator
MLFRYFLFSAWFVLLMSNTASAQDKVTLDSLLLELEQTEEDTVKINTLLEISRMFQNENYARAAEYAQQARDLAEKKKLARFAAKSNRSLALIMFMMGDYKAATAQYFTALKYYEEEKDTSGILAISNNLGVVYDRLKDYDKALAYYFKAQDLYNHLHPEQQKFFPLPTLQNNIGNIYQTKADFKSALQYYERALLLARETKNKSVEGVALNNLGKLYLVDLKQPEKALDYLEKGLKVREEIGDKAEIGKSLIFLSSYYLEQKQWQESRRCSERAIKLGEEIGSLEVQQNAYYSLYGIEEALGRYKESLEAFIQYKVLSDSIQNQLTSREVNRLQLQYDFEKAEQLREQEKKQTRDRYIATIVILGACLIVAILIAILIRLKARQTELKRRNLAQDVEIKNKELTTNVMYLIRKNELINSVAERLLKVQANVQSENHKVVHDIILDLQKEADNDSWKEFELRFNQVHSDFYNNLRKLYPGLSPAEEKLCAFLRLNMSSKEIAAITQQSIKSVEVARARLRKKLNLTNTTSNLVTHLSNL